MVEADGADPAVPPPGVTGPRKAAAAPAVAEAPAFTLPTTADGWATLLVTAGGIAWLAYEGQYAAIVPVLGLAYQQLKVSGKLAGALTTAFLAFAGSRQAVRTTETLKAAVKDIQDNPALPGTPGWMDEHDPHPSA